MDATPDFPVIRPTNLTRARIAVSAAFFLLGLGTGIWAVHIPLIQARLAIDSATLGAALFCIAGGAVVAMPLTGWLVERLGSRLLTAGLMFAYSVLIAVPILAGDVPFLFVASAFFGAAMGGLDVAANMQATEVERARGRPTMSSFHGFYSVGGLVGALLGAIIVEVGWGDGTGAAVSAVAFLVLAAVAAPHLYPSGRVVRAGPRFAIPNRAVVGLGILALLCFSIEGSVGDWSALFLSKTKLASATAAATGFALYSLAMAFCRLTGDWVVARLGGRLTVALGGGLITFGMAMAILSPWPILGAVGFGIVGVGAANVVPVVFSASSRTPGVSPSVGIAAVTTLGYAGGLVAPPLIGMVADASSLSLGLWLVAAAGIVVALVAVGRTWTPATR